MFAIPIFLALASAPAGASPQLVVQGTGKVSTPPDIVTIEFSMRGEGSTSDDAVRVMEASRRSIVDAVTALAPAAFEDGKLSIDVVRGQDCKTDFDKVVLSTGECAVRGYVASMDVTLRTTAIKDAATLVGLIGRLHGNDPEVHSFDILDVTAVRRSAMAIAAKDAQAAAEALARAANMKIGRIVNITDRNSVLEQTEAITFFAPTPPPRVTVPLPAVPVQITPAPIETTAAVIVTYELVN